MATSARAIDKLPAWLDLTQSASGLVLVIFMWVHMLMVSSIMISKDAMYAVTQMFEGYYLFGESHPALVSGVAGVILTLVMIHAGLAIRNFPQSAKQYSLFLGHRSRMHHRDTTFWWWQVVTGFLLFFLAPVHIYSMLSQPGQIGPYASSFRIFDSHWPLYTALLITVEIHAAIGLYRLIVKWGLLSRIPRCWLHVAVYVVIVFFIVHGGQVLFEYYSIGEELKGSDMRYTPAEVSEGIDQ